MSEESAPAKPDLSELRISPDRRGRRPTRWPWVIGALVLVGVGFLTRPYWQPLVDRWSLPEVSITKVRRVAAGAAPAGSLTANGYVVAQRQSALAPKQTGRLVELNVVEGSTVVSGEVVGRLEKQDLDAQLARARADFRAAEAEVARSQARAEQAEAEKSEAQDRIGAAEATQRDTEAARVDAERERDRQRQLLEDGFASQREFDRAETEVERAVARVDEATAQVASARSRLQAAELGEKLAKASVASAEAFLGSRQADVDLLEAQIEYTIIRAPFDGVVIQKNAEIGEIVAPVSAGAQARVAVVTIVDMSSLMVETEVNEAYIRQVASGQPVQIVLDAFPDAPYEGEVFKIVPTANRQKAAVEVKVSFDRLDERILPEMGARVTFLEAGASRGDEEASAPKLFVASSAVLGEDGARYAFVLGDDGRVARRSISVGGTSGGELEVLRGLSSGERVVVSPPESLEAGDRVRVLE
ncbi:MAG: efflux RND transporter periplasmic adaptor subunit [Planctomycetota bacterium]